jgi:hypothetical protein
LLRDQGVDAGVGAVVVAMQPGADGLGARSRGGGATGGRQATATLVNMIVRLRREYRMTGPEIAERLHLHGGWASDAARPWPAW